MGRLGMDRARLRRGNCVLAAGMAISLLAAMPRIAPAASAPASPAFPTLANAAGVPKAALDQFRGICSDLETARARLANGRLDESAFADTLLALFSRADTLAQTLAAGARGNPAWITLQRGVGYLIESLRDNWVGIAAKNGMSFAEADTALKAAVAWRTDVAEASTP
ncbi:MAG TPA: hypothetical protein VE326_07745 [Candidatus Binatia bacterium]|nr:hypothetical protein [Candidatus Binatia bacterium]